MAASTPKYQTSKYIALRRKKNAPTAALELRCEDYEVVSFEQWKTYINKGIADISLPPPDFGGELRSDFLDYVPWEHNWSHWITGVSVTSDIKRRSPIGAFFINSYSSAGFLVGVLGSNFVPNQFLNEEERTFSKSLLSEAFKLKRMSYEPFYLHQIQDRSVFLADQTNCSGFVLIKIEIF